MKKAAILFIAVVLLFVSAVPTAAVSTSAQSAVLINADTGRVIYSHNMNERLPMASTTKIMTGLLLAQENTPDKSIVITKEMVRVEGSSMGLLVGDTVTYNDLLYGLMLASGNDAANTVAISLCGSLQKFAEKMNLKAEQIGLKNTNFVTPSGLDDQNHYSTAYDLACLTAYALKNEAFSDAVSSKSAVLCYGNPPYKRTLTNHNKLLKMYDGAVGIKTGFTKRSGRCLVSAAKRGNITLIAVTLNDKNDWQDHINLLDYGFENSREENIEFNIPEKLPILNFEGSYVYLNAESAVCPLSLDDKITYRVNLPNCAFAPIKTGDEIGDIDVFCNGKLITTTHIIAENTVECEQDTSTFKKIINEYLNLIRSF